MTKFPAMLLLAVLSVGGSLPALAQRNNAQQQARADRKAQKKQQKAQKKYAKAQKKAQKKMLKKDRKNTHYPGYKP
jgi:regulator of protease activity HflC (stomatin/prohibitin superfamily)